MKKYETFLLKMDVDDRVKKQISDDIVMATYIHPPQIQKTEPGQYYHWHHDQGYPPHWKVYVHYLLKRR